MITETIIKKIKDKFVQVTFYKTEDNEHELMIGNIKAEDGTNISLAAHELLSLLKILEENKDLLQ